ncbi:endopeptidase La [Pasteuria penetrans]|uniref:endopeptidase La n=1 Tax=Pasteuria penetrans TaxID=86005 RepID=UPI000FA8C8AE|nr:endopeptidase La [Pasteuria penetrans]
MATQGEENVMPLLPLRGLLVFPTMVLHLDVGRERSVQALEKSMVDDSRIILATQREVHVEEPTIEDIYRIGTMARIRQMLKLPNGTIRVLVEGIKRVEIVQFFAREDQYEVRYRLVDDVDEGGVDTEALMRAVLTHFGQYLRLSKKLSADTYQSVADMKDPGRLADVIASHLPLKIADKQAMLEIVDVRERLDRLLGVLNDEREVLELEKKIRTRVKRQMEKTQKEYHLREQMKAIQRELGEKEGRAGEIDELRDKLADLKAPDVVRERVEKELERFEKIPTSSAEGSVVRTYVEWLLGLPWENTTEDDLSLERAEQVLNEDHYGLERVKERVLEYLAVRKMVKRLKGPILCLVGPPGVGKTSLARSVARAVGRCFVRLSLGGVRDEAEIRGHRRTYVGAMPGRIIQGMKQAGVANPVVLLDEIDKMSMDFRGDPGSALLEVLDPHQNHSFSDHYIEIPFDLSRVMFITTANAVHNIPRPLLDRMEVLYISGYTELEKDRIAKEYLVPKQIKEHGLTTENMIIEDQVLLQLIRYYTREAGVRNLERVIGTLCRKVARKLVAGNREKEIIRGPDLESYLGAFKFRYGQAEETDQVGLVTGLAWTEEGGDTLSVEVSLFPGKGKLTLTGQLGEVMKESAQAAFSYIRSRAKALQVDLDFHEHNDIHIHVPEGAIPKDGPSAGITIATALVSALTGIPVSRHVAMTGEITLRGRVLPIGGLKEKSLSAHRAGITRVLFPQDNKRNLEEIPESVRDDLEMIPVTHMDDVLRLTLTRNPYHARKD